METIGKYHLMYQGNEFLRFAELVLGQIQCYVCRSVGHSLYLANLSLKLHVHVAIIPPWAIKTNVI